MSDVDEMLLADDLNVIQEWLAGKVNWNDLSPEIQSAIDEVMLEMSDEQTEEPVEEPVEIATAEIVKQKEPDANLELLHKANEEQRFTLGPWYIPNRYDAHGEWTDADELQKSLWDYVKSGDRGIRLQHNKDIVAGEWVEAMAFPVPITIGMSKDAVSKQVEYPAGTVFLGVQWKPWAWELVKAGKIQGFSIGGAAARIDMGMTDAMAKASFASRSEAGRYAANQRWKDHISERVRGYAKLTSVNTQARLAEARRKKLEREKAGIKKPSLVDRVKYYMSDEYTNPEPLARREMRLYREADLKVPNSPIDRRGGSEAIMLPNGRMVTIQGKKIKTQLAKNADQIKAEMRVNARVADAIEKASFGGNRSEAGRYAANMRWMNRNLQHKVGMAGYKLAPTTTSGKNAAKLAPSLVGWCDMDALGAELDAKGAKIDDFQTKDGEYIAHIVYHHLTPERKNVWNNNIRFFLENVDSVENPVAYIKGGGAASGKSTSDPSIIVPKADPDANEFEAVLSNPDEIKERMPEYVALVGPKSDAENEYAQRDKSPTPDSQEAWMKAATLVHEESAMIAALVAGTALRQRKSVVVDGVCDNGIAKQYSKLDSYRKSGATKVVGLFYSADIDEATKRAVSRAYKVGRVVQPKEIVAGHKGVSKNFPSYATDGKFDSLVLFDTNARPATKIYESSTKSFGKVLNAEMYANFLAKADYTGGK